MNKKFTFLIVSALLTIAAIVLFAMNILQYPTIQEPESVTKVENILPANIETELESYKTLPGALPLEFQLERLTKLGTSIRNGELKDYLLAKGESEGAVLSTAKLVAMEQARINLSTQLNQNQPTASTLSNVNTLLEYYKENDGKYRFYVVLGMESVNSK